VFYFTLYSLGLRLGEGLNLQVGDIDASRMRVPIRNAKGNKDRLVPLYFTRLSVAALIRGTLANTAGKSHPVWRIPLDFVYIEAVFEPHPCGQDK
jgi:integrase